VIYEHRSDRRRQSLKDWRASQFHRLFSLLWVVTPGRVFPHRLGSLDGRFPTATVGPAFRPFRLPVDVRGAGCVASPFSRLFLTYRIRSLSSSFFIAYRCEYIILLILRLRLNRLRLAILAFTGTAPLGTGPVFTHIGFRASSPKRDARRFSVRVFTQSHGF
jgi:hypothetical protein